MANSILSKSRISLRRHWPTFVAILLLSMVTGCGPKSARISGKVTLQDVPITTGTIAFISKNGKVTSGNIENGNFVVVGAQVDPNTSVTVTSHTPSPMMQPPQGPMKSVSDEPQLKYVPIPDRYGNSDSSDLKCEVVEGEQKIDFDLQP
ncbi:hypothetical protein [Bythopirellula goksoeyrii]|uniref:Carboxypeptidase regulatory-like domain-containing protein n=1 Tax=Bythopirellula goksoeyrii TaxID=1400387 RepID=A0A5B9QES0_9BACT|nr:hypothetical protein [Bythopirellula goksoeyrii]QEG36379.1 hypothetical protein Pr1d_36930 [Bythopirellula goksoeyrii]